MMVKLNLNNNYKSVKEGERTLEIVDAKFTPSGKPNKLQLKMKDVEDGAVVFNNYNIDNDKGAWAMSMMLSIALDLDDGDEFDTKDADKLIGIKLLCEVTHSEYNDNTYANIKKVISKVDSNDYETSVVSESTDDDLD